MHVEFCLSMSVYSEYNASVSKITDKPRMLSINMLLKHYIRRVYYMLLIHVLLRLNKTIKPNLTEIQQHK